MVVKAVVDTGAVITIISPKLLKCTQFALESWHGPNIVMANGETVSPMGAAYITVTLHNKMAMGTALVLQMEDIDLLLGIDFLKQFGKLHIDYQASKTLITVGDLPLNLIEPQNMELAKSRKIQTTDGVNIPAFSIRHVPIVSPSGTETQLFTPSRRLMLNKALTVGHALLPAQATTVPIANISDQEVWLDKGSTLGTTQNYNKQVISCDFDEALPLPDVPEKTDEAQLRFFEDLEQAINADLSEEDRMTLKDMLKHHMSCFASNSKEVGRCTVAERIHLKEGAQPVQRGPYPSAWKARKIMQTQVGDMLDADIIEISHSAWSVPVVLILKPDGTWRFSVDYRGLNEVTVRNVYPLPRISDILSKLQGAEFFSIMDLQSGYHQLPLRKEDREKTAFVTPDRLYQFKVLPFGLANVPSTFQSSMDIILGGLRWTSCLVYLDDIVDIVYAPTFPSHLQRLNLVLSCLSKAGLKLKTSKCKFAMTTLKVLGHIVSRKGISPDPEKLLAVANFPSCVEGKTDADKVKRVQRFLGLCSYYRIHITGFSTMALPLILLTKKGQPFLWGEDQRKSFDLLKAALLSAPILAHIIRYP